MATTNYSTITYIGSVDSMHDQFVPRAEKNEWGVDVLTREVRGCVPAFLTFESSLEQGMQFTYDGKTFYLQTWQLIGDPVFPGFRLTYKGLIAGLPDAVESRSDGNQSATWTAEVEATTSKYGAIYAAQKDVQYISPQTTYRYITNGQPSGPSYSDTSGDVVVLKSVITVNSIKNDEEFTATISGNAPAAIVAALTKSAFPQTISHTSEPIFGTPYFECTDVVAKLYDV